MSEKATILPSYDVVVVGAGPAGSAAAVGHARRGQSVLLLEANPRASSRFAGEWIHPTGASVLRKYGLFPHEATSKHRPCYGFAVFPDDGSEPIRLEYADGAVGFSCEHDDLVRTLRTSAAATAGVTYVEHARVTGVQVSGDHVSKVQASDVQASDVRASDVQGTGLQGTGLQGTRVHFAHEGREHTVFADRVVAADGRSSAVRKSLRDENEADVASHMAGLELRDVELPFESYGHVLLGGPGPVLLYRIAPDRVRACIDVPVNAPGARRDARYVWDAFSPLFPEALRPALKRALENDKLLWACNRFLPRTFYGSGNVALVGDAVGFYHPLTASGITVGLKDTETLLSSPSVEAYHALREPQTFAPELLANALFHVFTRED